MHLYKVSIYCVTATVTSTIIISIIDSIRISTAIIVTRAA